MLRPLLRPLTMPLLRRPQSVDWGGASQSAMAPFWQGGIAGKKIVFWGDSTVELSSMDETTADLFGRTRDPLDGAVMVNGGTNGATLAVALSNGITRGISWLIAQAPDLVVMRYNGLNDARQGAVTRAQLAARFATALDAIHAGLPNCPVIFISANSLLTSDNGGYVVPPTAAQAYTDIMWEAWNDVRGTRTEFVVYSDAMTDIFGRTCVASSALMEDALHPSSVGTLRIIKELIVPAAQPPDWNPPIDLAASAAAWAANPTAPWLIYPRAAEDTRYTISLGEWRSVAIVPYNATSWLLDIMSVDQVTSPDPVAADFQVGDIVVVSDKTAPVRGDVYQQASFLVRFIDFLLDENTMPVQPPTAGRVSVYRKKP